MVRIILALSLLLPTQSFAFGVMGGVGTYTVEGGAAISDDFSSDTSSNYTSITNGISISGGTAGGTTNWANNYVYHNTPTGSDNHYVQAKLQVSSATNATQNVVFRCSGSSSSSTGYTAGLIDTDRLYLWRFSGSAITLIGYWSISTDITAGESYVVKISISGSTISAIFDVGGAGEESLDGKTDTTYSTGQYVGLSFGRGNGVDLRADDLEADSL